MDETSEFLKNTLPELDREKIEFLASHMVTLRHHTHMLDMRGKDFENEYNELKQMFDGVNESLKRSLEIEEQMQRRNCAQQEVIEKLRDELNKYKKLTDGGQYRVKDMVPGVSVHRLNTTATTSQCLANSGKPTTPNEDTSVKMISQEVSKLHDDIQRKELGIKSLQDRYNQSQRAIRDYKKKLGLPTDATHEEVDRRITEMKTQNLELKNHKTFLRKEIEKATGLQRDLKESHRKLEHLRVRLQHKELKLKQLEVQSGIISDKMTCQTIPVIPLPQLHVPQPMRQCEECKRPIQPIMLCDICTTKRLSVR